MRRKKNEEYRAMGCEIVRYGDEVNALEDRELEFMEVGEELKKKMETATSALAVTQSLVDEELANLSGRRGKLDKELEELEAERSEIAAGLDEDTVEVYVRLMKNKSSRLQFSKPFSGFRVQFEAGYTSQQ